MRCVLVALALALSMSSATAVRLFGSPDCGQWFTRNEHAKTWLLGYLSGLNDMANASKGVDALKRLNSADQAFLWMGNYCKANPLKTVDDGGWDLYNELLNKK